MGLIREWGLFKELNDKDIYYSFSSLLPHIFSDSTCDFTSQTRKFHRVLTLTILKLTSKDFKLNIFKIFGNFLNSICVWGLIERA